MAAVHGLSANFRAFFSRINPSPSYVAAAASAHSAIRDLIEDSDGPAGDLRIRTFLQGSYRRDTAIHTINDVDVVALCSLTYGPTANRSTRNDIFEAIGKAISQNKTYRDHLAFNSNSKCVKVVLTGVKVEILPALRFPDADFDYEPFYMFDPDDPITPGIWRQAFARRHHEHCSDKNQAVDGAFIPVIKCFKHVRDIDGALSTKDAVSVHIESLLYRLRDTIYSGAVPDRLEAVLRAIAGFTPDKASDSGVRLPTGDRLLFGLQEWALDSYTRFHERATNWYETVYDANRQTDRKAAIRGWQQLLGKDYFPEDPQ